MSRLFVPPQGGQYSTGTNRKDYQTAFRLFLGLAQNGNSDAQNNLAVMYRMGYGVTQNFTEAVKWFRRAAAQGNAQAHRNLAELAAQGIQ